MHDLSDESTSHRLLLDALHPSGLCCPEGHPLPPGQAAHDRRRAPVLDFRCRRCGRVFNLFTGTALQGTRFRCSTLVRALSGFARGVSTLRLSREIGPGRRHLSSLRRRARGLPLERFAAPSDAPPGAPCPTAA